MEPSERYREQRLRLTDLYADLDDAALATVVPGCPQWTVRDVLGHLAGVPAFVSAGDLTDAGQPVWTQRQVEANRDRTVPELLEQWAAASEPFEPVLDSMGLLGHVMVFDVTMHGDDVREALGLPLGATDSHAWTLDGIIGRAQARARGIGTLTVTSGRRSWTVGEGEPQAALHVEDEGELARVVGARRTDDQVLAHAWTGDPAPWLDALPLFRPGR